MNRNYLLIILFFSFSNIYSQSRDNYWPHGYQSFTPDTLVGGMTMDFWGGNRSLYDYPREMNFEFSNSSISDSFGNLLFYTNGVYIANALDDTMLNGSGLNPSFYTSQFLLEGLRIPQCNIILPKPRSDSLYYLFHETINISAPNCYCPGEFYFSEINMQGDSGRGDVTLKNQIILQDSLVSGAITACKHGNGRDWWVVAPEHGTELGAYIILVTPDTIQVYNHQYMNATGMSSAQACFSPDGSKYVINTSYGIAFYDFDRCNGVITFLDSVVFSDSIFQFNWGASISPNSRYCYLSHTYQIYQYDFQAADISSSQMLVAQWDSFSDPAGWTTIFWLQQIAPDGKIYVSTGCTMGMHIIDQPDSAGMACNVQQHTIHFPHFNCNIPNFPNYNLGPLLGSVCDSLGLGVAENVAHNFNFKIYPNPIADNLLSCSYMLPQNNPSAGSGGTIEIYSSNGKRILVYKLPQWSTIQKIRLPELSNGIYLARIVCGNYFVSKKFIIQK